MPEADYADDAHEADDAIEARVQVWDTQARQAWEAGDFTHSRQLFEKSLAAWRGRANSIFPLIHVTDAMRFEPGYDPAAARRLVEEALALAEHTGDEATVALVQAHLALVAQEQGDYLASFLLAQQLVPKSLGFTMMPPTWAMLRHTGLALMGMGRHEDGLRLYAAGTALSEGPHSIEYMPPFLRQHHEEMAERMLGLARSALSPERHAAVEMEGRALSLERAVEFALSVTIPGQVPNSANYPHS